jgi:hypothetical protein
MHLAHGAELIELEKDEIDSFANACIRIFLDAIERDQFS